MKIYTRTGDDLRTSHGGKRVWKFDDAIECQGQIDELNSYIGLCYIALFNGQLLFGRDRHNAFSCIETIQRKLFDIGAELHNGERRVTETDVKFIEDRIDEIEGSLPELKNFILPNNHIHVARAICRRVERTVGRFLHQASATQELNSSIVPYLNRLSDYLFTLARLVAEKDNIWDGKKSDTH
jgi:cob(I)alamin adenosyltransferase